MAMAGLPVLLAWAEGIFVVGEWSDARAVTCSETLLLLFDCLLDTCDDSFVVHKNVLCYFHGYLRFKATTFSTWWVCGNMSTGLTAVITYF